MANTIANNPISGSRFQNNVLFQAWLVLVLAISYGSALAFVDIKLSGLIAHNKMNETLEQIPELVWGKNAGQYVAHTKIPIEIISGSISVKKGKKTAHYPLYRVSRSGQLSGWVVKAHGQGYAGNIETLIGIDPDVETITGLFILEQKETPGLGNKITFPAWRGQFVGKKTDMPLVVVKTKSTVSNAIDAVTGATISSASVAKIVNQTMKDIAQGGLPKRTSLKGGINEQATDPG